MVLHAGHRGLRPHLIPNKEDENDRRVSCQRSPTVLAKPMVAIVRSFPVDVEDLHSLSRLPSVDDLRPCWCPLCGQPARPPGQLLGIVGHGTYLRQVLGLVEVGKALVIRVRRYLCRGCRTTISVLPDELLPRRWYAGTAILVALTLSLLVGIPAAEVRRRLAQPGETPGWKTLDRWQRGLLAPLWSWAAAQLGFADRGQAGDRVQRTDRLRRLLSLHGEGGRSPTEQIELVACALATGTAHTQAESWEISRGR